jgi:2-keto-4-pentenoate hydratase/2-oxohepta-3-ene-1,7-dioic acid hydratase in catechol pathway
LRLVSVVDSGARKAGILEQERVFVTNVPGLDVVISQRVDLKFAPGTWRLLSEVTLDVPPRPGAILGAGSNYRDHLVERVEASAGVNEGGEAPEFFVKTGSTVANLDARLQLRPAIGKKIDQETEVGLSWGMADPPASAKNARWSLYLAVLSSTT